MYPPHGSDHQAAKEGGDPDKLERQLRQEAGERDIAHDDSVVVGVGGELQRPSKAAGSKLGTLDAAGRELVEVSDGADGDATGEGGGHGPNCTELRAHRGEPGWEGLGVMREHRSRRVSSGARWDVEWCRGIRRCQCQTC